MSHSPVLGWRSVEGLWHSWPRIRSCRLKGPLTLGLVAWTHCECEPQVRRPPGISATRRCMRPSSPRRALPPHEETLGA